MYLFDVKEYSIGTSNTSRLNELKEKPRDEYYTPRYTADYHIDLHRDAFKDKIIYLPCDTTDSEYYKAFADRKDELGYKELIRSSIQEGVDMFSHEARKNIERCDIIITNPPFSRICDMFNSFFKDKNFSIISPITVLSNATTFKLLKEGKLFINELVGKYKYFSNTVIPTCIISNMKLNENKKNIKLKTYDENIAEGVIYQKPIDKDWINVDKTKHIPSDYDGVIGVPISSLFFDLKQFEIIGRCDSAIISKDGVEKELFRRILIQKRRLDYTAPLLY